MNEKKKIGRPSRVPGEKLERLQLNVAPKLKYGLELLARAQGRSLSQVTEWAIARGLHGFEVSRGTSLGEAVDEAWLIRQNRFGMLESIYQKAPEALSVDDRMFVRAVLNSEENRLILDYCNKAKKRADYRFRLSELAALRDEFVNRFFNKLREAILEMSLQGKQVEGLRLTSLLGLPRVEDVVVDLQRLVPPGPRQLEI